MGFVKILYWKYNLLIIKSVNRKDVIQLAINPVKLKKYTNYSSILTSLPHSSYNLTLEMKKSIKENVILANNDWYLNELYDFLTNLNITSISANYSRYVIDVNRKAEYKDNHEKYTESLVYFKTTFNKEIYDKPLQIDVIENRIEKIYKPYHSCLLSEISNILNNKNKVYLFDLHSFYHQSKADVVLGTRYGKTCSKEFLDIVYNAFVNEGFSVKVDEIGLRGGYITYHYSSIENVEAIQIEIRYTKYIENRYFDEEFMPKINYELFNNTKNRLNKVFSAIKEKLD